MKLITRVHNLNLHLIFCSKRVDFKVMEKRNTSNTFVDVVTGKYQCKCSIQHDSMIMCVTEVQLIQPWWRTPNRSAVSTCSVWGRMCAPSRRGSEQYKLSHPYSHPLWGPNHTLYHPQVRGHWLYFTGASLGALAHTAKAIINIYRKSFFSCIYNKTTPTHTHTHTHIHTHMRTHTHKCS